jgi:formyl-CoA transferase/CoA:oxalate CoA-transferase
VRVLDVTTSIAGPYCAQILATLGADVIKVERPDTGDDGRAWGPPFWNGEGTMFLSANAGKRSLALSLRDERGREALLRLVDGADVFLQSLRPGLADALGLGPDALRARNPRLVYCSVGAYGHVGPLSQEPGYDALMQAAGGLISITGEPGRAGVRVGSSLIDQGTGTWAAIGVLAALLDGRGSGRRRIALRDRSRLHRVSPRGVLRGGHRAAPRGDALPDGGAVPGVRDARWRADDRRRQRPAVRRDLQRPRATRSRRRPPLRHKP